MTGAEYTATSRVQREIEIGVGSSEVLQEGLDDGAVVKSQVENVVREVYL